MGLALLLSLKLSATLFPLNRKVHKTKRQSLAKVKAHYLGVQKTFPFGQQEVDDAVN